MFGYGLGASVVSVVQEVAFEQIKFFAGSGISTFEVGTGNFATDYDRAIRREFLAMCRDTGKRVISFHIPFQHPDDLSHPDAAVRRRAAGRFLALLDEASFWGAELIVLHPSAEPVELNTRESRINWLRDELRAVEPELCRRGMRVALEFLPRSCMGNCISDIMRMLEGMSDRFGCCADVNHLMGQYREIPQMIRTLDRRLITLHISDYDGIDERHWVPAPGVGKIEWQKVLAALREISYRGPFNLETARDAALTVPERIRKLEESYAWLSTL